MNKACANCREAKSINLFVKDKSKKDGYKNKCKKCENLSRRKTPIPPIPKEGYKNCTKCKEEKQLSQFNLRTTWGEKKPFSWCMKCEREYNNARYENTCKMCSKEYRSGKKGSTYCKQCHDKYLIKTYSVLHTVNWSGKNNPMYGKLRFGKENPNYNPDITDFERDQGRLHEGYGIWRKKVYERDNFTCQCCGYDKGGVLNAHHKDGYNWCKEKRLEVGNGVTLCKQCHDKFHKTYGFRNNTEKQFKTYMNDKEYSQ